MESMFGIEPLAFGGDSRSLGILRVETSLFGIEPLALGGNSVSWMKKGMYGIEPLAWDEESRRMPTQRYIRCKSLTSRW